jgi:hypothetical protein
VTLAAKETGPSSSGPESFGVGVAGGVVVEDSAVVVAAAVGESSAFASTLASLRMSRKMQLGPFVVGADYNEDRRDVLAYLSEKQRSLDLDLHLRSCCLAKDHLDTLSTMKRYCKGVVKIYQGMRDDLGYLQMCDDMEEVASTRSAESDAAVQPRLRAGDAVMDG